MRTIGLVGGTSWNSSAEYYRLLNERINTRLGGYNYARCILYSFNHADIIALNEVRDWGSRLRLTSDVCRSLSAAGAECIVLCANTMHVIADDLQSAIDIPVIHIAEATADALGRKGLTKVGLLGTRYTMEMDFFKNKLSARNIETIVPSPLDREAIHSTIFDELVKGIVKDDSRRRYIEIIDGFATQGAQGIILGCTEIPLLVKQQDSALPLFDTVSIHVDAAVNFALAPQE